MGLRRFDFFWGQIREKHASAMHFSTNSTHTKLSGANFKPQPAVTLALKPAFWEALLLSDNWKFWNEKSYKNVMPTVGMLRSMGFQKYA